MQGGDSIFDFNFTSDFSNQVEFAAGQTILNQYKGYSPSEDSMKVA